MSRHVASAILLCELLIGGMAGAEPELLRQADGTVERLSPLDGLQAIHSDPHGLSGVTHQGSGVPSHQFSSPHGGTPGNLTPFGTPAPPNQLTPAPLLPLSPRGMGGPQPERPRSMPGPSGSLRGYGGK